MKATKSKINISFAISIMLICVCFLTACGFGGISGKWVMSLDLGSTSLGSITLDIGLSDWSMESQNALTETNTNGFSGTYEKDSTGDEYIFYNSNGDKVFTATLSSDGNSLECSNSSNGISGTFTRQ